MFFKTDADRASAQAAKARHDAGEAGSNAASGARNLGAAVLATLAEVTAPADDKKGKKHAQKARAKAVKAARKDRDKASAAASRAAGHGRKAAGHGKAAADRKAHETGGTLSALADSASTRAAGVAATAAGTAKEAGSHLAHKVSDAELTDKARDKAKEKAATSAALVTALAAAARDKADETRTRALLGVDHGIDAAVPRAQDGVAAVGPRVDHLRDVINDELLPKLQAMLGDVQSGKDRLLTKDDGLTAALTGTPKKRRRKGRALITLGLLAAAGAGVAWYLDQQQRQGASDPWASRGGDADPWASRTPTGATDTGVTTHPAPAAGTPAATAPAGAVATGTTASADAVDGTPHLLESDEIDALAADTPTTAEEQTAGESPTEEIEAARRESDERP